MSIYMLSFELCFRLLSSFLILYFLGNKFEWKDNIGEIRKIITYIICGLLIDGISYVDVHFMGHTGFFMYSIFNFAYLVLYLIINKKGSLLSKIYWTTLI